MRLGEGHRPEEPVSGMMEDRASPNMGGLRGLSQVEAVAEQRSREKGKKIRVFFLKRIKLARRSREDFGKYLAHPI